MTDIFRSWVPLLISAILSTIFLSGKAAPAVAGGPEPGRNPLGAGGKMQIHAQDRCPVCAMLPIRYPRFAAAIERQDGRAYYFCSPGCMIKAWRHPEIFLGRPATRLKRPITLEYFSGEALDARDVFWISGSDVIGPMGPALIPLKDNTHVDAFGKRHGGKHIFRLEELNDANWGKLTGKQMPAQ